MTMMAILLSSGKVLTVLSYHLASAPTALTTALNFGRVSVIERRQPQPSFL